MLVFQEKDAGIYLYMKPSFRSYYIQYEFPKFAENIVRINFKPQSLYPNRMLTYLREKVGFIKSCLKNTGGSDLRFFQIDWVCGFNRLNFIVKRTKVAQSIENLKFK